MSHPSRSKRLRFCAWLGWLGFGLLLLDLSSSIAGVRYSDNSWSVKLHAGTIQARWRTEDPIELGQGWTGGMTFPMWRGYSIGLSRRPYGNTLDVPLWPMWACALGVFAFWTYRDRGTGRRCPHCGYSSAGLKGSRCPECGFSFDELTALESADAATVKSGKRILAIARWTLLSAGIGFALLWIGVMALAPSTIITLPNNYRGWAIIALDPHAKQPSGFLTKLTYSIPSSGVLRASTLDGLDRASGFPIDCKYEDGTVIPKWNGRNDEVVSWNFLTFTASKYPFVVLSVLPSSEQKLMKLTPNEFKELEERGIPEDFVPPRSLP